MKKILFNLLVTLSVAAACQKNVSVVLTDHSESLVGKTEAMRSRTSRDENSNVLWSDGDQITAFLRTSLGAKYQVTPVSSGKTAAVFTKKSLAGDDNLFAGVELEHNIALYPFADDTYVEKSGENYNVTSKLPSIQTYAAESFSNGAFPMVAVSENNELTFKNVCGAIRLQLKGTQTIKSIVIEGKNNEKLSGAAIVTAYPSGLAPAITMSAYASTSVTLACGEGVQLTEGTATDFIIALPPVLFSKGFTVKVTDSESRTYTVEAVKDITVQRSLIRDTPVVKLEEAGGDPDDEEDEEDEEDVIPVLDIQGLKTSLFLQQSYTYTLTAEVMPLEATYKTLTWSSSAPLVATVDQNGVVTAVSDGKAVITVEAGGIISTCSVTVYSLATATADYVDEYGVNHGKGIVMGPHVWAPVNCGYHATEYPYGKLYQWGRKYGQGLGGVRDAHEPVLIENSVDLDIGQNKALANYFFGVGSYNWLSTSNYELWNCGTKSSPVKTGYDPCPEGWRVPTNEELRDLAVFDYDFTTNEGLTGMLFYDVQLLDSQVFMPASGYRSCDDGSLKNVFYGHYWSSSPGGLGVYVLSFSNNSLSLPSGYLNSCDRANGLSVRCLQE